MFKPIKTILFATNLSENCRQAFDITAALAVRFQATIILLHVLEKMPDLVERRLKGLLGQDKWYEILTSQEQNARESLLGKKPSNVLIQQALDKFCTAAGIADEACGYQSKEILVKEGEVIEEIIACAQEHNCDMIIMGAQQGFLTTNAIGATIKSVMRQAKVPVMVVPPHTETEEQ